MRESEVAQSCPTLSDPMDCSPPGSSVHGIFQARVLEWGAIAFSWVPHELTANQKYCHFEGHLLLFYTTANHFSIGLWRVTKSGFYTIASDTQLSGWTKKKLQSISQNQTCTPKCHGHCLVVYCWSDPLQFSESRWNHYIREVCSANWWDAPKAATPASSAGQEKGPSSPPWQGPTAHHTTQASTVERIGLQSFASSAIFTWLLVR